jgi:NADH-quinone oxidoreductase subunit M
VIARALVVGTGLLVFAVALAALGGFIAPSLDVAWIPALGARLAFGGDALSWSLVALAGGLTAAAVGGVPPRTNGSALAALFAAMLAGLVVVFLARDLLLFYFGFEIALVPMYFIIGGWGEGDRTRAAIVFFIYTRVGSLAMLLAFVGLAFGAGGHGFAFSAAAHPSGMLAAWIAAGLIIGFAIKLPVVPLHAWLPLAHTEAPTEGSVMLAGLLLKLGGYGLLRVALAFVPATLAVAAPWLVAWGLASALWGALAAFPQRDLKRLVAYTSVNHMGYVLVAVAVAAAAGPGSAIGRIAVSGAALQMISHGLLTGGLFLISGAIGERFGTRDLTRLGGMAREAPPYGWTFAFLALGSLGIPALSGFAAELQIVLATAMYAPGAAVILAVAIVLTTALLARTALRLLTGEPVDAEPSKRGDADRALPWAAALLLGSAVLGIWPRVLVDGYVAVAGALGAGK